MKKSLRTKSSNNQIIKFLMIFGLSALLLSGCQQITNQTNGNGNANSNVGQTNANSETAKTVTNDLLGTWIEISSNPEKFKLVFTENEMTITYRGILQTMGYKRIDGQTIEVTDKDEGTSEQVKATVAGDELTVMSDGVTKKYKR